MGGIQWEHCPKESSARIKALKERIIQSKPHARAERALLVTKSYQETEGQPIVLRRAKALRKILAEMEISIGPGELIVGNLGINPLECLLFPETQGGCLEQELDTSSTRPWDPVYISEEDKEILRREVFPYWRGRSTDEAVYYGIPREIKHVLFLDPEEYPIRGTGIVDHSLQASMGGGHSFPNMEMFQKGLGYFRKRAEDKLNSLDLTQTESIKKRHFYEAVIISIDAVINHAHRYAQLAAKMSTEEQDPIRKRELEQIAANLYWVPENPARNFYEVIQAYWLVYMCEKIESGGVGDSAGRFDQWAYPYFQKDIADGTLTIAQALELIESLWIKLSEVNYWKKEAVARFHVGLRPQHLCTGGRKRDGSDATNELSLLCLQASMNVGLQNPALRVRLHKDSPREYILKTAELAAKGMGHPSIFHDDLCIQMMLAKGVSIAEARDYSLVGCPAVQVPSKESGFSYGGLLNLAAALELTLWDGWWQHGQRQIGPQTGKPSQFTSFAQFLQAFKTQVEYLVKCWQITNLAVEKAHQDLLPTPLHSALIDDCLEKGLDKTEGGAKYNFNPYLTVVGFADVVNSLAVIKKLIYEDKILSWPEMLDLLQRNFADHERQRQRFINTVEKYGNDQDYVDSIAHAVGRIVADEVKKYGNNMRGSDGPSGISLMSLGSNVAFGKVTAALPSGRKAGEPLADASSPVHGTDRESPTAILQSAGKLDHLAHGEPAILNVWFSPSVLEELDKLGDYFQAFVDLGVSHIQVNAVSRETLIDAQNNPEKYPTLLVRVSGYCAYFTELDREIQDDIIDRTQYEAV
ncbi:MAG: glycyl radical protein [bacterium]|jgi:pyruvate formate-lyase/glycerol dehydratase family glycyl radical enzyme